MPFPPNFDRAWDETFPPDTQAANLLGQDVRNFKIDIRERLALLSGTLANRPANMDAVFGGANNGILYFATDTGQWFQWNGAAWVDITANLLVAATQTNRAPNIVASLSFDITATANTTQLLFTVPANGAGLYRVQIYGVVISVTGGSTITFNDARVKWTDETGAQQTASQVGGSSVGTVGQLWLASTTLGQGGDFLLRSAASQGINLFYNTTLNGGGTVDVKIYVRVEYLG